MVMACLEGFNYRAPGREPLLRLAAMFGGGAICLWSLARHTALSSSPRTRPSAQFAGSAQLMVCWK
jgi:hypothetical protein